MASRTDGPSPYNRMWPKRFVVTLWTIELLYSTGLLAWTIFRVALLDSTFFRVFSNSKWWSNDPIAVAGAFLLAVLLLSIVFDVTAIVLFSKRRLSPVCYLSFQCIRLVSLLIMTIVWFAVRPGDLTALLIPIALPCAVTQLVYGAIVVDRNRRGFYAAGGKAKPEDDHSSFKDEPDTLGTISVTTTPIEALPSRKSHGAFDRMWPKRIVSTFWTLELIALVCVFSFSVFLVGQGYNTRLDTSSTITLCLCAVACIIGAALDIASIVSVARFTLKPAIYVLFQSIKTLLFFIIIVISAVASFADGNVILGIPLAAAPFLLAIGQLIYGAVVLQREKHGFYQSDDISPRVAMDEEQGMPQLHHVCVACGLHRPVSVYAYRGDDGATILTPAFSSRYGESMTLRSGPGWSVVGSDAAPPYSWKGSVTGPPSVMSSSLLEARSVRSPGPDWDAMSTDIAVAGVTEEPRAEEPPTTEPRSEEPHARAPRSEEPPRQS